MKKIFTICMLFNFIFISQAFSNDPMQIKSSNNNPYFSFKKGIGICAPDSSISMNVRFRMQNRFLMNTISDQDFGPSSWDNRVRRCRLSLTGHVYSAKLTYYVQLSFSRGDMDWSDVDASTINTSPNVVRDAVIYYKPNHHFQFGFGQTKLPGNRQRVVSSGALQFYDRSIVNAAFTLDRDFGFFGNYTNHIGKNFKWIVKTAITSGEGRNNTSNNAGLAYTGRLEMLPMGDFNDDGDYYEGDLAREEKPKVSIGLVYHYNDLAVRQQGQLGKDLYNPKSYTAMIADFLLKYKGFAVSSEYLKRECSNPLTQNKAGDIRALIVGDGINTQLSYCTKKNYEFAIRHSVVNPNASIYKYLKYNEQYGAGITKYIMKHKVKLQWNIFYNKETDKAKSTTHKNFFTAFQFELGI